MPGFSYRAPRYSYREQAHQETWGARSSRFFKRLLSNKESTFHDESNMDLDPNAAPRADETENSNDEHGHHGHHGPQGWGRGIIKDFKQTVGTHWIQEMTNFNMKTVAVSFFLFIAVIAPSITFGAVYAKRTNNYIGASELLLSTAWCGIFYALVSGQPMVCLLGLLELHVLTSSS